MKHATQESTGVCERLAGLEGVLQGTSAAAPRLLVVLAHPDDEVLALGGRMSSLQQTRFLTVTDGVPLDGSDARAHGFSSLEQYGRTRRDELQAALQLAGLDVNRATQLEVGPGASISDQRAAWNMAGIARALARQIDAVQPEAILTHPYEGGHPDHDACAFAVSAAVRLTGFAGPILEAPFYHADGQRLITGRFLSDDSGVEARLTPEQVASKTALLACFASQRETLRLFGVQTERFRIAPQYDFSARPADGQLHYERFPWGMDGNLFCTLAAQARLELGL